jgi:hypothetical protein
MTAVGGGEDPRAEFAQPRRNSLSDALCAAGDSARSPASSRALLIHRISKALTRPSAEKPKR